MNKQELGEAMVRINPTKNTRKVGQTIRYNSAGQSDLELNTKFSDQETAAMELAATTGTVYRVKAERDGHLYNPTKKNNFYNLSTPDRLTKELRFQFKVVSENTFKHYVKFLQEGHDSLLIAAEREI
jgi:Asp-tRNA(Asn)/Glu-tRNA(Gln) amidotransferase B subunit